MKQKKLFVHSYSTSFKWQNFINYVPFVSTFQKQSRDSEKKKTKPFYKQRQKRNKTPMPIKNWSMYELTGLFDDVFHSFLRNIVNALPK